jgi:hypothetical protein
MNTILSLAMLLVVSIPAQQPRPAPLSPRETKTFEVDGATISIAYGRPSMRGRKIFGGLRQYGVLWMPGADEASRIDTTADLRFGDPRAERRLHDLHDPTETSGRSSSASKSASSTRSIIRTRISRGSR